MTIPADILKMLNVDVGATLEIEISNGAFIARPASPARKRYSLRELLRGITPKVAAKVNAETEWAREGESVGRELP